MPSLVQDAADARAALAEAKAVVHARTYASDKVAVQTSKLRTPRKAGWNVLDHPPVGFASKLCDMHRNIMKANARNYGSPALHDRLRHAEAQRVKRSRAKIKPVVRPVTLIMREGA